MEASDLELLIIDPSHTTVKLLILNRTLLTAICGDFFFKSNLCLEKKFGSFQKKILNFQYTASATHFGRRAKHQMGCE
jgi:hypothetical protein